MWLCRRRCRLFQGPRGEGFRADRLRQISLDGAVAGRRNLGYFLLWRRRGRGHATRTELRSRLSNMQGVCCRRRIGRERVGSHPSAIFGWRLVFRQMKAKRNVRRKSTWATRSLIRHATRRGCLAFVRRRTGSLVLVGSVPQVITLCSDWRESRRLENNCLTGRCSRLFLALGFPAPVVDHQRCEWKWGRILMNECTQQRSEAVEFATSERGDRC